MSTSHGSFKKAWGKGLVEAWDAAGGALQITWYGTRFKASSALPRCGSMMICLTKVSPASHNGKNTTGQLLLARSDRPREHSFPPRHPCWLSLSQSPSHCPPASFSTHSLACLACQAQPLTSSSSCHRQVKLVAGYPGTFLQDQHPRQPPKSTSMGVLALKKW